MIIKNINKSLKEDEWGFYVDIETANFDNYDNYKIMKAKYGSNQNECISEEYTYYLNEQKKENTIIIETNYKVDKKRSLFNYGSTTFLTLLITYFVFCVI
jgi:hypothetical protein